MLRVAVPQNSISASEGCLDQFASSNLIKSLLLNSQAVQNLQSLQQLQNCGASGYSLPGLQSMLPNVTTAMPHTAATFGNVAHSGAAGSLPAQLSSTILAAISALQGRGNLAAGGLGSDSATLAAALQFRLAGDAGSAPERGGAGLGLAGLERLLGGAGHHPQPAGGNNGLQLPPMSLQGLHSGSCGTEDSRANRPAGPMGYSHDGTAESLAQAPLLAALAASIRATQEREAQGAGELNSESRRGRA